MELRVWNWDNQYGEALIATGDVMPLLRPVDPDLKQLMAAGLVILDQNRDIVEWVLCLVESWSPEMVALPLADPVMALMTPDSSGLWPIHVSYVGNSFEGKAHMWAFTDDKPAYDGTVGLIVPAYQTTWPERVLKWAGGGDDAYCAAMQTAATILHELVHIAGDGYDNGYRSADPWDVGGANHEDDEDPAPCWDEARMVATGFMWAMSQRSLCLNATAGCDCMGEPSFVAYSDGAAGQVLGTC